MPDSTLIKLGSYVMLRDRASGRVETHKIVLDSESDSSRGLLSVESSLGKSLLDRHQGAKLTIAIAGRMRSLEVLEVGRTSHYFAAGNRNT